MERITITAEIIAPIELVWSCWTKPEHITQWNFADPSWMCPKAENDLRIGGKYFARMEARDGSFGFDFEAIYDKVVSNEEIAYTMSDGRKANNYFSKREGNVIVETIFDPESENSIELQKNGWQAILNNFKNYVESIN